MATDQEKTQAQFEENMRTTIVSQARAIYGPKYSGCTFDVITSEEKGGPDHATGYVAWVVVYPSSSAPSFGQWKPVLRTYRKINLQAAYEKLIYTLRNQMADVIRQIDQTAVATEKYEQGDEYHDPWHMGY